MLSMGMNLALLAVIHLDCNGDVHTLLFPFSGHTPDMIIQLILEGVYTKSTSKVSFISITTSSQLKA